MLKLKPHPSRVQNRHLGPIVEIPITDDDIIDSFIVDVQQEPKPKDNEPTPDVLGTKGFQHVINSIDITAALIDTQATLFQCDINQRIEIGPETVRYIILMPN